MKRLALPLMLPLGAAALGACEEGLEPVPFQGISGTVTYRGVAPDSTEWVRLAVYRRLPLTTFDLLDFVAFSDTLSLAGATAEYHLPLDTGTYRWLPAVWKRRDAPLSTASLRVAGWHDGGDAFGEPKTFLVASDRETARIDLIVDFDSLLTPDQALEALR